MDAKSFGQYIRSIRKAKKMTIRQLELYSGVSNAYLSHIENGKRGIPKPDILEKLSGPLNVEYDVLMEKAGYFKSKISSDQVNEEGQKYQTNRDLMVTVQEVEELALKHSASTTDPAFRKILLKALDLALSAKQENSE